MKKLTTERRSYPHYPPFSCGKTKIPRIFSSADSGCFTQQVKIAAHNIHRKRKEKDRKIFFFYIYTTGNTVSKHLNFTLCPSHGKKLFRGLSTICVKKEAECETNPSQYCEKSGKHCQKKQIPSVFPNLFIV